MRINVPFILSRLAKTLDHSIVDRLSTDEWRQAQQDLQGLEAEYNRLYRIVHIDDKDPEDQ